MDFDLYKENVEVTFCSKGGGKIEDIRRLILSKVINKKYDIIIIVGGGNDLDIKEGHPINTAEKMLEMANEFVTKPFPLVKFVTICQIIQRQKTRRLALSEFQENVKIYNSNMLASCKQNSSLIFWSHPRINNSRTALEADGVHLNNKGNFLLYHSLKKSLAHTIDHLIHNTGCNCEAENPNPTSRARAGKNKRYSVS